MRSKRWMIALALVAGTTFPLDRAAPRPALTDSAGPARPAPASPAPVAPAAPVPAPASYAAVIRGRALRFPEDYGSHPSFRTEWWYVTGWLSTQGGPVGFQITFFRTKPSIDDANPSAFTPHQLLIAHCALSDPQHGRLWQDQRIRRAGLGLAQAAEGDTDVSIDNWSLARRAGVYTAAIAAENFALALTLSDTQPPLLQGQDGVSQKGPAPESASYYYSLPHMKVSGSITRGGRGSPVSGEAWFDHEWSSEYLDSQASGWDWTGVNLDDGGALMAFRMRDLEGHSRWAGATLRDKAGHVQVFESRDVQFEPGRRWRSSRTGIEYPIEWQVHVGTRAFDLHPLIDDQENDTRLSTGAIYWEGAVQASEAGKAAGRGYLELTGYGQR